MRIRTLIKQIPTHILQWINKELSANPHRNKILPIWLKSIIFHHKPIQYLFKWEEFLSIKIRVKSPVLIPRWETQEWTESLSELIKKRNSGKQSKTLGILDLCTGTGGISLIFYFFNFLFKIQDALD